MVIVIPGSSNGRTAAFEAVYRGSNPCPGTKNFNEINNKKKSVFVAGFCVYCSFKIIKIWI